MKVGTFFLIITVITALIACMPPLPSFEIPSGEEIPLPDMNEDEARLLDEKLMSFEDKELIFQDKATYKIQNDIRITRIKVGKAENLWCLKIHNHDSMYIVAKDNEIFLSDGAVITIGDEIIELRKGDNYGKYKVTQ